MPCLFLLLCLIFFMPLQAIPSVTKIRKGSVEYYKVRQIIQNVSYHAKLPEEKAINKILPGLYLGDKEAAIEAAALPNFTHVLSVIQEPQRIKNVVWKGINIHDKPEVLIIDHFDEAIEFIESATGDVVVHCRAGISRSATIVMAYLIWKFDVSAHQAYCYVRSRRPQVRPNMGFMVQLNYYQVAK